MFLIKHELFCSLANQRQQGRLYLLKREEIRLEIIYDAETKRHRIRCISDFGNEEAVKTILTDDFDPDRLASINRWLEGVMYGRSRLWYLIRSYNEDRDEDTQPELNPSTTFSQLLSKI